MTWVKLDDQWYDNPKLLDLPLESIGVWVIGLTYASRHLTDGFVPYKALRRIVDDPEQYAEALEHRGLWDIVEGGWQIHDYLDYQPSAAEVKDRRRKRSEAGKIGGRASAQARASGEANAEANRSTPSRPVPTQKNLSSSTTQEGDPQSVDNLEEIVGIIATTRLRSAQNVRNPDAYRRKIQNELRNDPEIRSRITELQTEHPDISTAQIAACLEGSTTLLKHLRSQRATRQP